VTLAGIWKVNEALGSWQKVAALPSDGELARTRRFVAYVEIAADGSRRELARGKA